MLHLWCVGRQRPKISFSALWLLGRSCLFKRVLQHSSWFLDKSFLRARSPVGEIFSQSTWGVQVIHSMWMHRSSPVYIYIHIDTYRYIEIFLFLFHQLNQIKFKKIIKAIKKKKSLLKSHMLISTHHNELGKFRSSQGLFDYHIQRSAFYLLVCWLKLTIS